MSAKPASVWTADDIIGVIRELAGTGQFPGHLIEGPISAGDSIDSLGIDSIGGVYLIDRLEELTGVGMPDDFVPPGTDIAGIAARVNELVAENS